MIGKRFAMKGISPAQLVSTKQLIVLRFFYLFLFSLMAACGGGGSDLEPTPDPIANIAPTANAGIDQTVNEQTAVQLSGIGTDVDGTIMGYSWTQTSGTSVVLNNANTANASFTSADIAADETLIFLLTVTDDDGATGSDQVNINLLNVSSSVANSDEFSASVNFEINSSSPWTVDRFDGTSRAMSIDANMTKLGWLVLVPDTPPAGTNLGWFEDTYGPFVYQNVSGNFVVATKLRVVSRNDINVQPASTNFNAGGLVIRDPSGAHNGNENWVMYNMGAQVSATAGNSYAREIKKTVNSISNMFLTDQENIEEHLLVCRIDEQFYFYYWDDIADSWQEETFYNNAALNGTNLTTRIANGTSITPEIGNNLPAVGATTPISFSFDSNNNFFIANQLQVGVIAHNWSSEGDTRAEFDYVRFAASIPATQNDCLSEFANLGNE